MEQEECGGTRRVSPGWGPSQLQTHVLSVGREQDTWNLNWRFARLKNIFRNICEAIESNYPDFVITHHTLISLHVFPSTFHHREAKFLSSWVLKFHVFVFAMVSLIMFPLLFPVASEFILFFFHLNTEYLINIFLNHVSIHFCIPQIHVLSPCNVLFNNLIPQCHMCHFLFI